MSSNFLSTKRQTLCSKILPRKPKVQPTRLSIVIDNYRLSTTRTRFLVEISTRSSRQLIVARSFSKLMMYLEEDNGTRTPQNPLGRHLKYIFFPTQQKDTVLSISTQRFILELLFFFFHLRFYSSQRMLNDSCFKPNVMT